MTDKKTRKVQVEWVETHCYAAEVDVPNNISEEDELDWVLKNKSGWDAGCESYDIHIDWLSFQIYEVEE